MHSYTQSLRVQLKGKGIAVVKLPPPGVETPLFRGEFAEETRGQKGMETKQLVRRAIAGIEADKPEIRPGLANVLNSMSRVAPRSSCSVKGKDVEAQNEGSLMRGHVGAKERV